MQYVANFHPRAVAGLGRTVRQLFQIPFLAVISLQKLADNGAHPLCEGKGTYSVRYCHLARHPCQYCIPDIEGASRGCISAPVSLIFRSQKSLLQRKAPPEEGLADFQGPLSQILTLSATKINFTHNPDPGVGWCNVKAPGDAWRPGSDMSARILARELHTSRLCLKLLVYRCTVPLMSGGWRIHLNMQRHPEKDDPGHFAIDVLPSEHWGLFLLTNRKADAYITSRSVTVSGSLPIVQGCGWLEPSAIRSTLSFLPILVWKSCAAEHELTSLLAYRTATTPRRSHVRNLTTSIYSPRRES